MRIFAARTKPRTVLRKTVNDFVERLFGGETMPLVRHLIEKRGSQAIQVRPQRRSNEIESGMHWKQERVIGS
ncbi:hypothetical protein [Aureliella helgolandensis]|uniref:hypothetical protein n=1 Tax=Aureliella helgolandensis TaxID=2527968 RepID=UPI0011AA3F69|nr:hypothetical protein [Aureliella helgolandensis]